MSINEPAQVTALIPVKSLRRPAKMPPKMPPMSNNVDKSPAFWLLSESPKKSIIILRFKVRNIKM